MMFIAILLRPIILIYRIPGVLVMRILADDILLLGFGSEHLPSFIEKFEAISSFLQHMGSRVSAKKSFLFSSTSDGRDFLKRYVWDFVGTTLRLVQDFRDVGAHLCISVTHRCSTLTKRIQQGIPKINRARWLPHSTETKESFISGAIFSGSLYGCESTHVNEAEIMKLSTATARALGHSASARASTELFFNTLQKEVEPWAVVFIRRVVILRRMLVKHTHLVEQISDTIHTYTQRGFPGTLGPSMPDDAISPAPPLWGSQPGCVEN